jgi:hypothetical protein
VTYLTFQQLERSGRLGNCLWEIASTIGLARRHGMEPRFNPSWSYRRWFSIPDEFFEDVRGTPAWTLPDVEHIDERTRVYLQDLSLWSNVEDEVRSYFQPSPEAQAVIAEKEWRSERPVLAIHVRRTDAVTQPDHYPLPSIDYYLDSIGEGREVEIYGDDFEWNRQVLAPKARERTDFEVRVIEGLPRPAPHMADWLTVPIVDWLDLFLMAQAQAFTLSPSTFGWWSAWLSGSHDVVYPDPWYGPGLDFVDASLMIPATWKRMAARPEMLSEL